MGNKTADGSQDDGGLHSRAGGRELAGCLKRDPRQDAVLGNPRNIGNGVSGKLEQLERFITVFVHEREDKTKYLRYSGGLRQWSVEAAVAIEEVIEEHYQQQLEQLGEDEPELRAIISEFREDELRHRDTALENGAEEAPAHKLLSRSVKAGTKIAIWLAKRF